MTSKNAIETIFIDGVYNYEPTNRINQIKKLRLVLGF